VTVLSDFKEVGMAAGQTPRLARPRLLFILLLISVGMATLGIA
jgi:hypothetical protein